MIHCNSESRAYALITSYQTSPQSDPSILQSSIFSIKREIMQLRDRIHDIIQATSRQHRARLRIILTSSRCHNAIIQKRIRLLNQQRHVSTSLHHRRLSISNNIIANFLEEDKRSIRQQRISETQRLLQSADKIHNFTTINLPEDFKDLLNKGTNFIPTIESIHSATLKNTVSREVRNTLCTSLPSKPLPLKNLSQVSVTTVTNNLGINNPSLYLNSNKADRASTFIS